MQLRLLACHALAGWRGNPATCHVGSRRRRFLVPFSQTLRVRQRYGRLVYCSARRCKYECAHLVIRISKNVLHAGPTAHGLSDQAHVWKVQMLDQGREIAGEVLWIGDTDLAPRWIATMSEYYARITIGEVGNLLPPS